MSVTITNLVGSIGSFESGTWLLTTAEKAYVHIVSDHVKYGASSLRIMGDTAEFERTYTLRNSGGVVKPTLDPTHKYYVRVETYQEEATGSTDIYWPIAEPSMLAGQSGPAGQWNVCSAVADRSSFAAGSYEMRIDYNNANTAGRMWFDGLMLVDLTDAFGAGYEPTAAWCDANIPFTASTADVPEPVPKAPTGLMVAAESKDGVTLAWDAAKWAEGYKVYQDGTLLATVPGRTTVMVQPTVYGRVLLTVSAYNSAGESAQSTAVSVITQMYLITDRTAADLARWQELHAKGYSGLTAAEKIEWAQAEMRGAYNVSDLNRVGNAIVYLRDRLRNYGYSLNVTPKTNWAITDAPTVAQLKKYLADVSAIRGAVGELSSLPEVPVRIYPSGTEKSDGLTIEKANDIERMLSQLDSAITKMLSSWWGCSEIGCGEV